MYVLGNQNNQTSLLDVETWLAEPLVDNHSIYGLLATWGTRLVREEDFVDIYSETGRSSVSPALLSKVLLLMYHDQVSDREAEERAKYDLRWKVALRLPMNESGFDHTALCRFRARLLVNKKQKIVFERFVHLAKDAGIIKDNGLQIIDSTHVLGAAAVKDTYNLIKGAIQKMLGVSRKKNGQVKKVFENLSFRLDYRKKEKEDINWDDPKAREELLNQLVQDSQSLIDALHGIELSPEEETAKELLKVISTQDVEVKEDNSYALKKGVAKDRVISVVDPEMRHGHKTSKGKFDGHKAQVMMDEASEIITHVDVTPGNQADGESLNTLLEDTPVKPGTLMGDTAYGTLQARDVMGSYGIIPVAPIPMGKKGTRFGKAAFKIDFEKNHCQCPAGNITIRAKQGKLAGYYYFSSKVCNPCPLRDQCTRHGIGKAIILHPEEQQRREIIKKNDTDEFRAYYRRRSKIERKNAHLKQRGMRKARYIGKAKTLLQLAFTAAVVNLKRIFTVTQGKVYPFGRLERALGNV